MRLVRSSLGLLLGLVVVAASLAAPLDPAAIEARMEVSRKLLEQIVQIEAVFEDTGSLARYEREYLKALAARPASPVAEKILFQRLATSPYVFVSDVHNCADSQGLTLEVMRAVAAGPGPVTLVLEWVDRRFQGDVDAFLAGKITLSTLRRRICYEQYWSFPWTSYRRVLDEAKRLGLAILLSEDLENDHGLAERDAAICDTVATHRDANPGMRYMVVYGAYHLLGPRHLTARLATRGLTPQVIIVDESDTHYWATLKAVKDPDLIEALDLGDGVFYVERGSPVERHRAYRNFLMSLTGWEEEDFDESLDEILAPLVERRSAFDAIHSPGR